MCDTACSPAVPGLQRTVIHTAVHNRRADTPETPCKWGTFDHIGPSGFPRRRLHAYRAIMRANPSIEHLLDQAQADRRCAIGATSADRRALAARVHSGSIVTPYRGMYARRDYWDALNPIDRTLHTVRALALQHPAWVFAGLTAACIHSYDHSWSLHGDGIISIASPRPNQPGDERRLHRIYIRDFDGIRVNGLLVTDPIRTLLDCGGEYSFVEALPLFDSAARQGVQIGKVNILCNTLGLDSSNIRLLCAHASALSDNGGESTIRALIISNGFLPPEVQRPFANPNNPNAPYRADLTWRLPDDRIIVAEYDGMAKYVAQEGMKRRTIQAAVQAERARETNLMAQGVSLIIRLDFDDIVNPERLIGKLTAAGIPRASQPFVL